MIVRKGLSALFGTESDIQVVGEVMMSMKLSHSLVRCDAPRRVLGDVGDQDTRNGTARTDVWHIQSIHQLGQHKRLDLPAAKPQSRPAQRSRERSTLTVEFHK